MNAATQLEISPADTMYEGSLEHYFAVGESAVRCVRAAMLAANKTNVNNILDFGCGFGRVLRALKAEFPKAHLSACDVSSDAIHFCAKALGADPVLSAEDPAEIRLQDKFDLIWCGTLLTQFDAGLFTSFLDLLHSLLTDDGLLIFTTHGPFVARRLREHAGSYGLNPEAVATVLNGYHITGFGYVDHPREVLLRVGVSKYGFSVSKPSWVCGQIEARKNMRLITYTERAWDNHQDSIACVNE